MRHRHIEMHTMPTIDRIAPLILALAGFLRHPRSGEKQLLPKARSYQENRSEALVSKSFLIEKLYRSVGAGEKAPIR